MLRVFFIISCFASSLLAYDIRFDKDFSADSGASLLYFAYDKTKEYQQQYLESPFESASSHIGISGNDLNFVARILYFVAFDAPIQEFFIDSQHNTFGFDWRKREFDISGPINDAYDVTAFEKAAIYSAGIEANAVFSKQGLRHQFRNGEVFYTDALLYYFARRDFSDTVFSLREGDLDDTDRDIAAYLDRVNDVYDLTHIHEYELTLDDLDELANFSQFSPVMLTYYAAIFKYLFKGDQLFAFPYFRVKESMFFLDFRPVLTPFGAAGEGTLYVKEWTDDNVNTISYMQSIGHFTDFWTFAFERDYVFSLMKAKTGLELAVWQQPLLTTGQPEDLEPGGAFIVKSKRAMRMFNTDTGILFNIGYKSQGFYSTYPLDEGVISQIGVSLNW